LILLCGLLVSQLLAAGMYTLMSRRWQHELRPETAVSEIALAVHWFDLAMPAQRRLYDDALDDEQMRVQWIERPSGLPPQAEVGRETDLRERLASAIGKSKDGIVVRENHEFGGWTSVLVDLKDGSRLEFLAHIGFDHRLGLIEETAAAVFFLFAFAGIWGWMTVYVQRPVTRFAQAAEEVGRHLRSAPLAERGPAELRQVAHAFNGMQRRLQLLVEDRTRMLAAISHDLRTPLTRLRLRIETTEAPSRECLLADIGTMESMTSSALSFIQGIDDGERREYVELGALIETVCDSITDLGGDVRFAGAERLFYPCRPVALMRALSNVVMNAVRHADGARIDLRINEDRGITIAVEDSGDGIPEPEKELVFEPFYRRAHTRTTDPQGLGLGLSIARSIALAHGGGIELEDAQPRGLRVMIYLPPARPPPPVHEEM
jgi:signal transduction histidine kinase